MRAAFVQMLLVSPARIESLASAAAAIRSEPLGELYALATALLLLAAAAANSK